MFITLTNASALHTGAKIAINADLVVTVHTAAIERSPLIFEQVTFIFCPPYGTWEVSESHEQVVKQLNQLQSSKFSVAGLIAAVTKPAA